MPKSPSNFSGIQSDIFQRLETPATESDFCGYDLDITLQLRSAVDTAMKLAARRGMTRERLVDELNRLLPDLPTKITKRKIDAWMARSREDHPIPAYVIPAICIATQCDLPLREMANAIDYDIADQRERLAQEYGELEIKRAALARKSKLIKNRLGEQS